MSKYCITAAHPKDAAHHINSEFKFWEWRLRGQQWKWVPTGWKRVSEIAALLEAGHEILTGKEGPNGIRNGAAVEAELRISHNDTNYKISEMPDK